MSARPILDAGPALNFFATNSERLLLSVLGQVSLPETVASELTNKAVSDARLAAAGPVWSRLATTKWVDILPDDPTPELAKAVACIGRIPMEERLLTSKNLGEIMVIGHAAVRAEAGTTVIVLIDDGDGARLAQRESNRLKRLRDAGHPCGEIQLIGTHTVLARAAGSSYLQDRAAMRALYRRMRSCDDGLVDIRQTHLLSAALWPREA